MFQNGLNSVLASPTSFSNENLSFNSPTIQSGICGPLPVPPHGIHNATTETTVLSSSSLSSNAGVGPATASSNNVPSINGSYRYIHDIPNQISHLHSNYPYFYYASLPLRRSNRNLQRYDRHLYDHCGSHTRYSQHYNNNYYKTLPFYYSVNSLRSERAKFRAERQRRYNNTNLPTSASKYFSSSSSSSNYHRGDDRYVIPSFSGLVKLGEVLQQYSGSRDLNNSVLSSLATATSYTITTSDSEDDDYVNSGDGDNNVN